MFIIDYQLFPSINYISRLIKSSDNNYCLFDPFKKMSFQNRYIVAGANGLVPLTVPLIGGREQKILFKDVQVNYTTHWNIIHWKTLVSCYNNSPFFEYYKEELKSLFLEEERSLKSFQMKALQWILNKLSIPNLKIEELENIPEGAIDLRNSILPKNFQQGGKFLKYAQVFESKIGFQPNLSILDLLFCEGPNSYNLLQSF